MVTFFFILVVPPGGVSIFFIIIQPIVIGTYWFGHQGPASGAVTGRCPQALELVNGIAPPKASSPLQLNFEYSDFVLVPGEGDENTRS